MCPRIACLAGLLVALLAACSGGGGASPGSPTTTPAPVTQLKLVPLPPLPSPVAAPVVAGDDDSITLLSNGALVRIDPFAAKPQWREVARQLPAAQSTAAVWNDHFWYATRDRGPLEAVSISLSGDARIETRVVGVGNEDSFTPVPGGDAIYFFGASSGFTIDTHGTLTVFDGPGSAVRPLGQLADGSIAALADKRLELFDPNGRQWRDAPPAVVPLAFTAAAVDGGVAVAVVTTAEGAELIRFDSATHIDRAAYPFPSRLLPGCAVDDIYASDLGPMLRGCGRLVVLRAQGDPLAVDASAPDLALMRGPRGRPVAARGGQLLLADVR